MASTLTRGSAGSLASSSAQGAASASDALATVFASCPRERASPMQSARCFWIVVYEQWAAPLRCATSAVMPESRSPPASTSFGNGAQWTSPQAVHQ